MSNLIIRTLGNPTRCEICHLSDLFDPQTNSCQRCQHLSITLLSDSTAHEQVEEIVQYQVSPYLCSVIFFLLTQIGAYIVWSYLAFWAEELQSTGLTICTLAGIWMIWMISFLPFLVSPSSSDSFIVVLGELTEPLKLPLGIVADIKKVKAYCGALIAGFVCFFLIPHVPMDSSLQRCFEDRCTQTLKLYLAMGLNPNAKIQDGIPLSLLYWAILNGNEAQVKLLLDYGANPNDQADQLLVAAVSTNNVSVITRLLQSGARPVKGEKALQLAERKQNQEIIRLLNSYLSDLNGPVHLNQLPPPDELKPQSNGLLISIGFPIQTDTYQLPDQYPMVQVIFTNTSTAPIQFLAGDKFSTGSKLLQMELRDKDGTITPLTRSTTFLKPVHSVLTLLPGESKVFSERLDGYGWTGFPKRTDEKSRFYEIRGWYENLEKQVPSSPALWTGRVESKWIKFELIK